MLCRRSSTAATDEEREPETQGVQWTTNAVPLRSNGWPNWRTLRAFLVSVAPFEDRGAALVDDPLDASEAIVQMPASMAPSPLELIEGQPR